MGADSLSGGESGARGEASAIPYLFKPRGLRPKILNWPCLALNGLLSILLDSWLRIMALA